MCVFTPKIHVRFRTYILIYNINKQSYIGNIFLNLKKNEIKNH